MGPPSESASTEPPSIEASQPTARVRRQRTAQYRLRRQRPPLRHVRLMASEVTQPSEKLLTSGEEKAANCSVHLWRGPTRG
jgi:hypothetical protein